MWYSNSTLVKSQDKIEELEIIITDACLKNYSYTSHEVVFESELFSDFFCATQPCN